MKKTLFIFWAFLCGMVMVGDAYANGDSLYSSYLRKSFESKKLILSMDNMLGNRVTFRVLDPTGYEIHKDIIETQLGRDKKFDFSKLESGTYTLIIDDLMKVEKIAIHVSKNQVLFSESEADVTYKPVVWVNADRTVDFNLLALGQSATVRLSGVNGQVYEERFSDQMSIAKQFNLKNLPNGVYTMSVDTKGETFYRYIHL